MSDPRGFASTRKRLGSDVSTLLVGSADHRLTVHNKLLRKNSPYFDICHKAEWNVDNQSTFHMSEDIPAVVNFYVHWLYTDVIFTRGFQYLVLDDDENETAPGMAESEFSMNEYGVLVDAYVLGEKLHDQHFKKKVIDAIISYASTGRDEKNPCFPSMSTVEKAYEGTTAASPLRRLLVDITIYLGEIRELSKTANVDVLQDTVVQLDRVRPRSNNHLDSDHRWQVNCNYYES